MSFRLLPTLLVVAAFAGAGLPPEATGETRRDLSNRISIDGFATEYLPDETLFQASPGGRPEESTFDSKWGVFNDVNQIRLTWDADFLYIALEGFMDNNNIMVFFDTVPGALGNQPGLTGLVDVNAWRRNVTFDNGIFPDAFLATWDDNTTPQLWTYSGVNQVTQVPTTAFQTVATFSNQASGRAAEAAIPWDLIFLGQGERRFLPEYGDSVYVMPERGGELKLVAWITAGGDGTGGPDSAPDNLGGHQVDGSIQVVLDNFIRVQLDTLNAAGEPVPDGVPDFGVPVRKPTLPETTEEEYRAIQEAFFFFPPPVLGQAVEVTSLEVNPRLFAPELGEGAMFRFRIQPPLLDPDLAAARAFRFSSRLYDLRGRKVRTFYTDREFTVSELEQPDPPLGNLVDGRDDDGNLLPGGTYVLVVVMEPLQSQERATVTIVR